MKYKEDVYLFSMGNTVYPAGHLDDDTKGSPNYTHGYFLDIGALDFLASNIKDFPELTVSAHLEVLKQASLPDSPKSTFEQRIEASEHRGALKMLSTLKTTLRGIGVTNMEEFEEKLFSKYMQED